MESIVERCCGLDVHSETVVACLLVGLPGEKPRKEVRTFRTFTSELEEMRYWLQSNGCTVVAMESTGIYWMPVYWVLDGAFELIVGNACHIKNVPGRKTDVRDAEWIADLARHGLIRKSFVPCAELRELRELLRYRRKLVDARSSERNRLLRVLHTANIKLSCVASNVFGVSGMLMLRALLDGDSSPEQMAELAHGRLRRKRADLVLALHGRIEEHHRFMIRIQLDRLADVERDIVTIERRVREKLEPYREQVDALTTIPGVDWVVAAAIVAEIGVDMTAFRSVEHLASWVGVCPGNYESAGKKKGSRTTCGNVHLKTALVQAANAAVKKKGTYFKDKFHRLRARRGYKRAIVAIAHKILISAYHILRERTPYRDLGAAYLDARAHGRVKSQLVRRLEHLGFDVTLTPKLIASPPSPAPVLPS